MPTVSVIIPCYNQGHYLEEALNSVLTQTYKDFEIIIVNDGSTDENTNHIIANCTLDNEHVIQTQNQGLPEARNTGIRHAVGQFILPLDADNKIEPAFLEKSVEILYANRDISIVYTDAYFFGNKKGLWQQPEIEFPLMLKRNLVDACSIYKKEVWEVCGGYNKNMLYGWEDWDFWLTAYEKNFKFHHIKEPLFFYRMGEESMRDQIAIDKKRRIYLEQQLVENHIGLYKSFFSEPLTLLRELDALHAEKSEFERYKREVLQSYSYRLGNCLLWPFKWIRKISSK